MPEFVNPKQVLNQVGLRQEMIAADFGSGAGGWAIPLAEILNKGLVYAIDVQEHPLSALEGRAKLQGLSNIRKILANVEINIPELDDDSCDFVLMTDLLFQVDEKEQVFKEAARLLKEKGKVLAVEWQEDSPLGPKEGKIPAQEVKDIARRAGFILLKEFQAGDYHFALLFVKNNR